MNAKSQVTQVEIFGQTYSVRAVGDTEYIRELSAFVDRKMREVADHAPTVDATKIAILAALNISDEYHQFRTKAEEGDPGRFAVRATRLVERLDEILKAAPPVGVPQPATESIGALRGT
ncbi:cell division protein ZapA [Acidobacteria bacterium ACD]|nr:MAG: cell division protein ZapA [Acidobacteriota bacterium]MCE7958153.1 cell division protein ZapA [Acidobacteria bacterium ACB2]MDL1949373.1 cell division protein ZapA [Acidobacteria bacterium ACD]